MKASPEVKRLALKLWRDREARFPAFTRRWSPDEMDHASGAWAQMVQEAERQLAADRGQGQLEL